MQDEGIFFMRQNDLGMIFIWLNSSEKSRSRKKKKEKK